MKPSYKTIASLSVAVVMVALIVAAPFWAFRQMESLAEQRKHSFVAIDSANQLLSALKHIIISIMDNGVGLTPEKLAQLFQPFNRFGHETGVEQGSGIGLVISKKLVEWISGTLSVLSKGGRGQRNLHHTWQGR